MEYVSEACSIKHISSIIKWEKDDIRKNINAKLGTANANMNMIPVHMFEACNSLSDQMECNNDA